MIGHFPEDRNLKALEDYALWLRTSTQTRFSYVNEPLLVYRDFPNESIRSEDKDEWTQRRRVFRNLLRWFNDAGFDGEEVSKARKEYFIATKESWKHSIKSFLRKKHRKS